MKYETSSLDADRRLGPSSTLAVDANRIQVLRGLISATWGRVTGQKGVFQPPERIPLASVN
jgi:hypothetical protein